MEKKVLTILFISVFLLSAVASVYANCSVESTIEDNSINIVCSLTNLNQTIYEAAKTSNVFNGSAITQTIAQNLKKENRTNVTYDFDPHNAYDDVNRAIGVAFHLGGTDIITSTINQASLKRNFQVKTDWRKFKVNLTSNVSIDFATYFAESVEKWQRIDYKDSTGNLRQSYYYETAENAQLGKMSFRFIMPSAATNVQATGDTITFDVPLGFEDVFIGSPFPVLVVIIVAVLIVLVYRRIR
jgi:hypothetical protein